jgi:hypothetical protein
MSKDIFLDLNCFPMEKVIWGKEAGSVETSKE